jgi:hypothetical protein
MWSTELIDPEGGFQVVYSAKPVPILHIDAQIASFSF